MFLIPLLELYLQLEGGVRSLNLFDFLEFIEQDVANIFVLNLCLLLRIQNIKYKIFSDGIIVVIGLENINAKLLCTLQCSFLLLFVLILWKLFICVVNTAL